MRPREERMQSNFGAETTPAAQHVLIIDDDEDLRRALVRFLNQFEFQAEAVGDSAAMRRAMARRHFDIILLDLALKGENGLSLTRSFPSDRDFSVIMMTGSGGLPDRILGLEFGADDFLQKPFDPRELVARIRAMIRRRSRVWEEPGGTAEPAKTAQFGPGWRVEIDKRNLLGPAGDPVPLTSGEFDLLAAFLKNRGKVLSRQKLLDLLFGAASNHTDRTIDIRVMRLRKKLGDSGTEMIKTVGGTGYIFTPDVTWGET